MLLNRDRANEVMDRVGIDALVAMRPLNVYYLSDYHCAMSEAQWDALWCAVLPRRDDQPPTLITSAMEMLLLDQTTWMPRRIYCTAPIPGRYAEPNVEPPALPFPGWPIRADANLSEVDLAKIAQVDENRNRVAAGALWGLVRALREAGLEKARIAVDDARIAAWLPEHGLADVAVWVRPDLFMEVRLVKTEAEIELLRVAARINENACISAGHAIREGGTEAEVQRVYMAEMARQGGRGTYLVTSLGGLPHGHYVRGEPVMLDALGTYRLYHGDIGRTAVIGTPSSELVMRNRAVQAGWRAACERIRPGVRYSEVTRVIGEATRAAGFREFGVYNLHNVGLQHTDDPAAPGLPPGFKDDRVLEQNMVINIDLPHEEFGWGTAHLEDTVRVTADGFEPLTSQRMDLIVLSGR